MTAPPLKYAGEAKALSDSVSARSASDGAQSVAEIEDATKLLREWLFYLAKTHGQLPTLHLLRGVQAAIVEVAGLLSLGLVRPALFSIRAQIDMLLSWLYYKDHPMEWKSFDRGADFRTRKVLMEYMETHVVGFKKRRKMLTEVGTRTQKEPYQLLSKHVHGQTTATIPAFGPLEVLVGDKTRCAEVVKLQAEVTEYLTDILTAFYADSWQDLPEEAKVSVKARLQSDLSEFWKPNN